MYFDTMGPRGWAAKEAQTLMIKYTINRILQAIPILLLLSFVIFVAVRLMPGGRHYIDFKERTPFFRHYVAYMQDLLHGNLGRSFYTGRPVNDEIANCYGNTLVLALGGTALAAVLGVALGLWAAINYGKALDSAIMAFSLTTVSIPLYFSSLILMLVFCLWLGWLPSRGLDTWKGYILPMVSLALPAVGFVARTTRGALIETLGEDYIRASRARGLPERMVVGLYALRNTLIPLLTAIGIKFGELLAGTVLVENAFSIPGLGRLIVDSVEHRDYGTVQGSVLVIAGTFLLMNIVIDLLYALADPRLRHTRGVAL